MRYDNSVTDPERRALDNIPEFEDDAAAYVASDPLWDMERRWRQLGHKYDDIPASCFTQCADELRAALLRYGLTLDNALTCDDLRSAATACEAQGHIHDRAEIEATGRTAPTRGQAWKTLAEKFSAAWYRGTAAIIGAYTQQQRHPRYPFDVNPEKKLR